MEVEIVIFYLTLSYDEKAGLPLFDVVKNVETNV